MTYARGMASNEPIRMPSNLATPMNAPTLPLSAPLETTLGALIEHSELRYPFKKAKRAKFVNLNASVPNNQSGPTWKRVRTKRAS